MHKYTVRNYHVLYAIILTVSCELNIDINQCQAQTPRPMENVDWNTVSTRRTYSTGDVAACVRCPLRS